MKMLFITVYKTVQEQETNHNAILINVLSCVIHMTGFCESFKRNKTSVPVAKQCKVLEIEGLLGSITGGHVFLSNVFACLTRSSGK